MNELMVKNVAHMVGSMKRKDSKTITLDLSLVEYESIKKISVETETSMTKIIRNLIKGDNKMDNTLSMQKTITPEALDEFRRAWRVNYDECSKVKKAIDTIN